MKDNRTVFSYNYCDEAGLTPVSIALIIGSQAQNKSIPLIDGLLPFIIKSHLIREDYTTSPDLCQMCEKLTYLAKQEPN